MATKPGSHQVVDGPAPCVPVFVIPAYSDADTMATGPARGEVEFITEPMDFPKLKQGHHGGDD